jgi:hypothetical protein
MGIRQMHGRASFTLLRGSSSTQSNQHHKFAAESSIVSGTGRVNHDAM